MPNISFLHEKGECHFLPMLYRIFCRSSFNIAKKQQTGLPGYTFHVLFFFSEALCRKKLFKGINRYWLPVSVISKRAQGGNTEAEHGALRLAVSWRVTSWARMKHVQHRLRLHACTRRGTRGLGVCGVTNHHSEYSDLKLVGLETYMQPSDKEMALMFTGAS